MANNSELLDRKGQTASHLKPPNEICRPFHHSLHLDLEGLDLGGPRSSRGPSRRGAQFALPRALFPDGPTSMFRGSAPSSSHTPYDPTGKELATLIEDTFVAHLRHECVDVNEILPAQKILEEHSSGAEAFCSLPDFGNVDIVKGFGESFAASNCPRKPHVAQATSQQVLGGFASIGASALPVTHSTTSRRAGKSMANPAATSPSHAERTASTTLYAEEHEDSLSVWQSMTPVLFSAMRLLDLMSIEEMGKHSVNVGNNDDWDGTILVPSASATSRDVSSPSSSLPCQVSWMAARSTHGKCKWIAAPVLSDDEAAAARSIVVSDKARSMPLDLSRKPPPAFSGLASFELRALRDGAAKNTGGVILANPSTVRLQCSRVSACSTRLRSKSRRADSFAGFTSSASFLSSSQRQGPQPRLRRTRSRPATKHGTFDYYDELSVHDQQLIQSLKDSGFIESNAIVSSAEANSRNGDMRRRPIDTRRRADSGPGISTTSLLAPSVVAGPDFEHYSMLHCSNAMPNHPSQMAMCAPSLLSDPPIFPSDCVGLGSCSRPLPLQTRSFEDREAVTPHSEGGGDALIPAETTFADVSIEQRPRIRKQSSSFGVWLKKKIAGPSKKIDKTESAPFPQNLYHRRGSASDESVALNAGKSDRKKAMGGSAQRRASKHGIATLTATTSNLETPPSKWMMPFKTPDKAIDFSQTECPKTEHVKGLPVMPRLCPQLACDDLFLGLEDVPESALTMLLPLGSFRDRSEGRVRRCLRVAFVPFNCRRNERHACVAHCTAQSTSSSTTAAAPQWYRRFGKIAAQGQSPAAPVSGTEHESYSDGRPSSVITEAFLFGAGPAPKPSEAIAMAEIAASDNRRSSSVEAFRVTAQVLSLESIARGDPAPSDDASMLPEVSPFPVILAVCFTGKSLEFVSEGWESLNLGNGPAVEMDDPMYGVADAIVAACVAVMDL